MATVPPAVHSRSPRRVTIPERTTFSERIPRARSLIPNVFSLYTAWETSNHHYDDKEKSEAREEIAAGEKLFNTLPLIITGVRGLNDNPALGSPTSIAGTCTTCHDTPNVGNHSVASAAGYRHQPAGRERNKLLNR